MILNYADAGLRVPKGLDIAMVLVFEIIYLIDLPEDSMVSDISQVILIADRCIFVPSFHRGNKHTVPPVRGCSVFIHDVFIGPIYSSGDFAQGDV